jgi:hypothetical protein
LQFTVFSGFLRELSNIAVSKAHFPLKKQM